jgi:hypothetical protein
MSAIDEVAPFPDVRSEMRFDPNPSVLSSDTFLVGSKGPRLIIMANEKL